VCHFSRRSPAFLGRQPGSAHPEISATRPTTEISAPYAFFREVPEDEEDEEDEDEKDNQEEDEEDEGYSE